MSLGRLPVKVHVRLRPVPPSLQRNDEQNSSWNPSDGFIEAQGSLLQLHDVGKQHTSQFSFDNVFGSETDQAQLHKVVGEPLVEHVLSGYNACCFAYGQTGSGKTYSMVGQDDVRGNHLGLAPRCLEGMFKAIKSMERGGHSVRTRVSFIEIYQENVRDLGNAVSRLSDKGRPRSALHSSGVKLMTFSGPTNSAADRKVTEELAHESLDIVDDPVTGTKIRNLHEAEVQTAAEAIAILLAGTCMRATAATGHNNVSSRSHTVFTVSTVITSSASGEPPLAGKLNLVDLAGSESLKNSGDASEERLAEARSINSSLSALGKVVMGLSTSDTSIGASRHVPFRDSKLTRVLKDSLTGNSCTYLLACLYPQPANLRECQATLQFAVRCTNIHTAPVVNTVGAPGENAEQAATIARLNGELQRLQQELDQTRTSYQKLLDNDEDMDSPDDGTGPGDLECVGATAPACVGGCSGATPAARSPAGFAPGLGGEAVGAQVLGIGGSLAAPGLMPGSAADSGAGGGRGGLQRVASRQASTSRVSRQVAALQADAAKATERAQSLDGQLGHTQLTLADTRAEHAALQREHAELLDRSIKAAADATAARLRAQDCERGLRAQLAAAKADMREAGVTAAAALADCKGQLQQEVEGLQRHNTELLCAVPDALQAKAGLAAQLDGQLRVMEAALREGFEVRAAAAEAAAAQQVNAAEERARGVEERCEGKVQAARREARIARDDATAVDEAWRKEAVVLWEYVNKLAAAWDTAARRRSPARAARWAAPGVASTGGTSPASPAARPQTAGYTRPAASTVSASGALHACAAELVVSSGASRDSGWEGGRRVTVASARRGCSACATPAACHTHDAAAPQRGGRALASAERAASDASAAGALAGPLDARGLAKVLRAVRATESYLHCTGRLQNLPDAAAEDAEGPEQHHDDEDMATGGAQAQMLPGWKLALAKLRIDAAAAAEEIATLRAECDRLAADCDTLRLEGSAAMAPASAAGRVHRDCNSPDVHEVSATEAQLQQELQRARAAAQHAQRHAESLQVALAASHRMLGASGSPAVAAVAKRPPSRARPTSAPLRRPATTFSLTGPGQPHGGAPLQLSSPAWGRLVQRPWDPTGVRSEETRTRPFSAVQTRDKTQLSSRWTAGPAGTAGSVHSRLNRHAFLSAGDFVATPEDAKRANRRRPVSARPASGWRTPGSAQHWT
eukprot:jgi/Ulvmu1/9443/UM052_0007.1